VSILNGHAFQFSFGESKSTGPKKIEHVGRSSRKSEARPSSPPSPLNDQTSLLTPTPLVMPPEAKLPVQLATKPSEVFQVLKPSRSPHVSPSPQLSSFSTILSTLSQAIRADETTQQIFSLLSSSTSHNMWTVSIAVSMILSMSHESRLINIFECVGSLKEIKLSGKTTRVYGYRANNMKERTKER
jgi:hypothetical protein